MTIDPLETIIKWLGTALTLVHGRVAGKNRYGSSWEKEDAGVSVHLDGGAPDLYAPVAMPQLELRIYADDQEKIMPVYRELIALSRVSTRFVVETTQGNALVHYFKPVTSLSMIYDEVLKMDVGVVLFETMIAESKIG